MTSDQPLKFEKKIFYSTTAILIYLAIIKLIIPLITHPDFELHRDAFLYLAMADHLAWGYAEVPPAIALFAWISKHILGIGIYAVRFLPALSGAVALILTGFITRELGGGRFAQILAVISFLSSVVYLRMNLFFQPVSFNLLFYLITVFIFIKILKNNQPRDWILLGITTGLGLLNKYTMLLPAFGIAIGLIFTPYRKFYQNKWLWISALIAFAIWLPNLIWQHTNGWPFLTHMQILSERQLTNVQPHLFILVQFLFCFYATPVWVCGYFYLQFSKSTKPFRPLAYMYISTFFVLLLLHGKSYYLAPAYPMLLAAGGVLVEKFIISIRRIWLGWVFVVIIITGSITLIPVGLPVLSVEGMIGYFKTMSKFVGMKEALRWETGRLHQLPQDYADMLGWEAMVVRIAETYHGLSDAEKQKCTLFASNYGQAGAITYYAAKYRIPCAISQNGSFWTWGPGNYSGDVLIIAGLNEQQIGHYFSDIEQKASFKYPYARESGMPIIIGRGLKTDVNELWQELKQYRY